LTSQFPLTHTDSSCSEQACTGTANVLTEMQGSPPVINKLLESVESSDEAVDAFASFRKLCLHNDPVLQTASGDVQVGCFVKLIKYAQCRPNAHRRVFECATTLRDSAGWTTFDAEDVFKELQIAGFKDGWESLNATAVDDAQALGKPGTTDGETTNETHDKDATVVHRLHLHFNNFAELVLKAEGDSERRQEIKTLIVDYKAQMVKHQQNARLHFPFAGLVSSGKTTMLNSVAVNTLFGFPQDVELLPSDILENTAAVTVLELDSGSPNIQVHKEVVKYEAKGMSSQASGADAANMRIVQSTSMQDKRSFAQLKDFQQELPKMLSDLSSSSDCLQRLVVKLPYPFYPFYKHSKETGGVKSFRNSSWFWGKPDSPKVSWTSHHSVAPILVDTPGLDSPWVKHHLLTLLEEKCFVFTFLVDMMKPNAFGKQGFEVLRYLNERVRVPFPPIIVFTKWEQFCEQWQNPRFKRSAKGESPEQVAQRLINTVLVRLKQAGVSSMPFFAAVDGLSSLQPEAQVRDPEEMSEVVSAKGDICKFMHNLHELGTQVATPLFLHRWLSLLVNHTQKMVNIVLQDDEAARLVTTSAMGEVKQLGQAIKTKFKDSVSKYFDDIEWTKVGVLKFSPPEPFTKSDCAVNRIPAEFDIAFSNFQESHENIEQQGLAIKAIAEVTIHQVTLAIMKDMQVYEQDAMDDFHTRLWHSIPNRAPLIADSVKLPAHQRTLAQTLTGVGTIGGISLGVGWAISSIPLGVFAGLGILVALPVMIGGLALMQRFELGFWTWEGCEKKALDVVFQSLESAVPCMKATLVGAFSDQVDEFMKSIDEFRFASTGREDTRQAVDILEDLAKEKNLVEERLQVVLKFSRETQWLAGNPRLEQLVMRLANNAYQATQEP